ncbi:hypothetical protein RYX36_033525 [Vicia faba]
MDEFHNLPFISQMDKASLFGRVIQHLKEVKRNATQVCEEQERGFNSFPYSIKASMCCEYQPGLL